MQPDSRIHSTNEQPRIQQHESLSRRAFLTRSAAMSATGLALPLTLNRPSHAKEKSESSKVVRTVLGPVSPEKLGVTLMHEHAPIVDWSELYEVPPASAATFGKNMLPHTVKLLDAFGSSLGDNGPGAIVECTPIRVGRYPRVLVKLAQRTSVHIVACTGFWCEAFAPQHPWAVRMGVEKEGVKKIAKLYIREITEGMEDPHGEWGERFTDVKVGIIKCATSKFMRPSESRCHQAAAIASKETGCPLTTHTTDGGGLEEAALFVKRGVNPDKVVIGHQGNLDDREHEAAHEYHRQIVSLGCNVQFDRVGHEKYPVDKMARQVKYLVDAGFAKQVLAGHDHVPFFYGNYTDVKKTAAGWIEKESDYTVVPTRFVTAMKEEGISAADIQTILVENPKRVLAF